MGTAPCRQKNCNVYSKYFHKLKRLQIKQIKDKVSLAVRKCKTQGRRMTACEVLSSDFIDTLVKQNDGFRVLRNLRGSPQYWAQAKKDVFAMIRQLGIPTWFCSFSAAETKWTPLLICLSKLVRNWCSRSCVFNTADAFETINKRCCLH